MANAKDPVLKVLVQINLLFIKSLNAKNEEEESRIARGLCASRSEELLLMKVHTNCDLYYDYTNRYRRQGNRIARRMDWARRSYE